MDYRTPGFPAHHLLLELAQTHVLWVGDAIQPSCPLLSLLLLLPSIFCSNRVFSKESVLCIRWPKYWSFNSSISPSNKYSGLISFRMDWFGLLAIQGTLTSRLQHHSSKASILQCSGFFWFNSHIHTWLRKNHSFLLFKMLSKFSIAFLPRSKHHLISWLQPPSAVILEPEKIKSGTV